MHQHSQMITTNISAGKDWQTKRIWGSSPMPQGSRCWYLSRGLWDIKVTYHWKFFWTHYYHILDINIVNWASCLSCIVQDYTDNLQQNSDDKIQNLFQRKYVHLLIVCWKNQSYPVLLPFLLCNLSNPWKWLN